MRHDDKGGLDRFERVGIDPGTRSAPSRVTGGEYFAVASHRAKPLHWSRILLVAGVVGAVLAFVVALVAAGGSTASILAVLPGVAIGLVVATLLERTGRFRRVDELWDDE